MASEVRFNGIVEEFRGHGCRAVTSVILRGDVLFNPSVSQSHTPKQDLDHNNIPKGASKGAATPTGAVLTKDIASSSESRSCMGTEYTIASRCQRPILFLNETVRSGQKNFVAQRVRAGQGFIYTRNRKT